MPLTEQYETHVYLLYKGYLCVMNDALLHFMHKFNSNFFNTSETEEKGLINIESHREKVTFFFSVCSESVLLHQGKT